MNFISNTNIFIDFSEFISLSKDLSAEKIVKILIKQHGTKENFNIPHKLCRNEAQFKRMDRDHSL